MKRLISFVASILVLGGLMMFFSLNGDRQLSKEEQQYHLEVQIAKMLVNDYEGVESIEFQGWGHSIETGMWGTTVIVNHSNELGFSFSGLSGLEEIRGISYHPDTFKLVEKADTVIKARIMDRVDEINVTSLNEVSVTYSKDEKEE